jgi:hypothetical protein
VLNCFADRTCRYDLQVSLFGPPNKTPSDQAITLQVFANMTRLDSFFVEGGGVATFPALQQEIAALVRKLGISAGTYP